MKKRARWLFGWILVRPVRWAFSRMAWASYLRIKPEKQECDEKWRMPNIHWWLLYLSIFRFFKWLDGDAWRVFCDWTGGFRRTYPWPARFIHSIGAFTAGYAISGGQCFHCASPDGCQVTLSDDDSGKTFRLLETWSVASMDGTDHHFRGITICPKCGYENEYEEGSL